MKTPAPQRAAGRKKLAAMGQALPDGTAPIPDVAYLKKAIRAKGRVDPSKWPALKALIVKRAKALGATNTPGVKGTWAFQAANDTVAIELVGPKGYEHGWIKVGVSEHDAPEDRADKMSGNVFKRTDGSQETMQGHRDAAKAHRYASRLSSSSAVSAYHSKMAALHTRVASGRMTSNKAADQAHTLRSGLGYANDGEALEMSSYVAPHMPAGSPAGGQFGTTSGGGGQPTPAQQHAAHDAHLAHLQHLVDTGKATPAQKAELAAKTKAAKKKAPAKTTAKKATTAKAATVAKPKAATATTAKPKAAAKPKAPAKPKVNKTKGTVTATVGGKKVTMTLHQWHQLHVAHEKAIKAANDTEAIEMATATPRKMPMVRGAADVQLRRTGPGVITVQHKSTGMKVGTITPKGVGWQGMHATGTATGASGSQQGALTGLIAFHNKQAAKAKASGFPPAQQDGTAVMPGSKTYTAEQDAVDLAGALPVSTPASSSSDGPRVTSMGSGKAAAAPAGSPSGLSPYALAIYKKFIAKKMKPAVALAFAKRADAMHAKAA